MKNKSILLSSLLITYLHAPALANSFNTNSTNVNDVSTCNIKPEKVNESRATYSKKQLESIANQITVRVIGNNNYGSGTIISKRENSYLVLTNSHLLLGVDLKEINVQTHDRKKYKAQVIENAFSNSQTDLDIAILKFTSEQEYCTPIEGIANFDVTEIKEDRKIEIIAAGYSINDNEIQFTQGEIGKVFPRMLKNGYQIGYTGDIEQGMSGGPILGLDGKLLGINSVSSNPISNSIYAYADQSSKTLTSLEIKESRQFNWGVPTVTFLLYIDSQILGDYKLPVPNKKDTIGYVVKQPWLKELESKSQQFVVRIEGSNGVSGSGIIVARKDCCQYTVLTTEHVIGRNNSSKVVYKIFTPDGRSHVTSNTYLNKQKGIDLALVQFSSNENYQIAKLANYNPEYGQYVFSLGYPKGQSSLYLSLGQVQNEKGLINTIESDFQPRNQSLAGGYKLVYNNITYAGMSGGPVVDIEGRVIAIHGRAEGEQNQYQSEDGLQVRNSLGIPVSTIFDRLDEYKSFVGIPETQPPSRKLKDQAAENALLINIPKTNTFPAQWLDRANKLNRSKLYQEALIAANQAIQQLESSGDQNELERVNLIGIAYHLKVISLNELRKKDDKYLKDLIEIATKNDLNTIKNPLFRAYTEFVFCEIYSEIYNKEKDKKYLNIALSYIESANKRTEFKNQNYVYELYLTLTRLGRKDEAKNLLDRAYNINTTAAYKYQIEINDITSKIERNPRANSKANHYNRAIRHIKLGDFELAERDLQTVLGKRDCSQIISDKDLEDLHRELVNPIRLYLNLAHVKSKMNNDSSTEADMCSEQALQAQTVIQKQGRIEIQITPPVLNESDINQYSYNISPPRPHSITDKLPYRYPEPPKFTEPRNNCRGGLGSLFGGCDRTPEPPKFTEPRNNCRGGVGSLFGGCDRTPEPPKFNTPEPPKTNNCRGGVGSLFGGGC